MELLKNCLFFVSLRVAKDIESMLHRNKKYFISDAKDEVL